MRFLVRFLRHHGRILPWREVMNRSPLLGDLRIEESRVDELRRYVKTARLFDEANVLRNVNLPQLLDVHIMAMSPQVSTPTGFERNDGIEYAQSWLVSTRE